MFKMEEVYYLMDNPRGFADKLNKSLTKIEVKAGKVINTSGTAQVETATVVGTVTLAGNASVVVTATGMTGSPKTIAVAVALEDTATLVAGKIRTALSADTAVSGLFTVGGTGATVVLTKKVASANDTALNVATDNDTCTGLTTAATSVDTTAGVAPADGLISLDEIPSVGIVAVFAFTTATGAVATKALLASGTDFSISGKVLTMLTNQSANTLFVVYK